ncbi:uncharacterized protein YjiS (DUF1127 family) [Bradyrhizobium huanghuaihaiense]|uniref:DUF1127 domain-containing protein n=1 Tax=Bradyrhizobium huanghuaihaiense TaxID=990078 RepID=A0A562S2S2_9BRAD|nr:hypothetical protein [Bradyrhizobium huanghuaihaiense]TWI74900.1 hypothetical protein IQ16_01192 [Bradyrhizobium huanghuaihaiense]
MSMSFADRGFLARVQGSTTVVGHKQNSWLTTIDRWLARIERINQRDDLRAIADNPHLLADLGLTREEALEQANKPFWR